MKLNKHFTILTSLAAGSLLAFIACNKENESSTQTTSKEVVAKKKIKALLVTGEGYHDYEAQKKIITEGTSKLIDIEWTVWHHKKPADAKTALSVKGWADPYDIVVYNICHASEKDANFVNGVVEMHKAGKPCVAIHCSMHSYHWKIGKNRNSDDKEWNKLLGVRSPNHGKKAAISVTKLKDTDHAAVKNMPAEWKTPMGELYNIHKVYDSATVLAHGNNGDKKQGTQPVVWVNKYGKANVFATTLGHHNETMKTKEFLQTVSDGIVWAVETTAKDKK